MVQVNFNANANLAYAVRLVHATCCLAGSPSYLDDLRDELREAGIVRAARNHDTPALFDWLIQALSFQGISDSVAADYIEQHGSVRWSDIAEATSRKPSCSKLGGHWLFHDCNYQKGFYSCKEPGHFNACPLPRHLLRNGRLNQTAYSLFFFIRDVADGDFVGWVDRQLSTVNSKDLDALRESLIGPLRNVYGVADKVLATTLSSLLLAAAAEIHFGSRWVRLLLQSTPWSIILERTGFLGRFSAEHPYGPGCYRPGGCDAVLRMIAAHIDAREFNPTFPARFPRFVQNAIWRYCAEAGLDVCNGNRIDDSERCGNAYCQLFRECDRIALRRPLRKRA